MNEDTKYMEAALREAEAAATEDEVPVGAVIVCNGKIIAKGHNMTERLNDPTAHAEMIALTYRSHRRKTSQRLHPVCHGGAMSYVRSGIGMGATRTPGIWSSGHETRLHRILPLPSSPQNESQRRCHEGQVR